MRIAIIGSGISGLYAAWLLHRHHEVMLFESGAHIGGHTNTIDVETKAGPLAIDTGFIVYNDRTYPHFIGLLDELGVETQATNMSFSVRCDATQTEYCGTNIDTVFAQRRNLLRPLFWGMLRDIVRFNREVPRLLSGGEAAQLTLGEYLESQGYGQRFRDHYIIPMVSAIWSADPRLSEKMPMRFFARFFHNHGLLQLRDRPKWRVIRGGSRRYVERLCQQLQASIHLNTPVHHIKRDAAGATLALGDGQQVRVDGVVLATHSDQALKLIERPTPAEREILGAIHYQHNRAVLHTDTRLLPQRQRAWAAWNYHIDPVANERVTVTYDMNILQGLDCSETYCVTLNSDAHIDPQRIVRSIDYQHPLIDNAAVAAQQRHSEINGQHNTWFCGAYWGNGFHEDGVKSALNAVGQLVTKRQAA